MIETLTSKSPWSWENSVLTAILSIILPFILTLELRRTGLLSVLVKSFHIGILHKLLELPHDIWFRLRIFIVWRLINVTALGLQCPWPSMPCFCSCLISQSLSNLTRRSVDCQLTLSKEFCQYPLIPQLWWSWHEISQVEIWAPISQSWVQEWFPQD